MHASPQKPDIKSLIAACQSNSEENTLSQHLSAKHWEVLAKYLQVFDLGESQMLISQGDKEQSIYFIESGRVSVHFEDASGKIHLAMVGSGSVVGEGAFFSQLPRSASVQAATGCKVWHLNIVKFKELSMHFPEVALTLSMALGAIIARRMRNLRRRTAIT